MKNTQESDPVIEGANSDRDGSNTGLIIIEVVKDGLSFPERWESWRALGIIRWEQ